jgi:hypothetical protein
MADESDAELLERYRHICDEHRKARQRMERMKLGSGQRGRQARFVGSLEFTRLQVRSEIEERGLGLPE